jgi:ubiquinone/menaquinone biosynthesis C-methylase UbiE
LSRPYYDKIAKAWHEATGSSGGAFKKHVLNDRLLASIDSINGHAILEIGAGNGYFARLMAKRFSGQVPSRWLVTDISRKLLRIAESAFKVPGAEYRQLDARKNFPFEGETFDLILATMIFNELRTSALEHALRECFRILQAGGRLIVTVPHPKFVDRLEKSGKLSRFGPELWTMPGKGPLRLPIVPRAAHEYDKASSRAGFVFENEWTLASNRVLNERPGLLLKEFPLR